MSVDGFNENTPHKLFLGRLLLLAIFAITIGVLGSLAAIAFVRLVLLLNEWFLVSPRSRMMLNNSTMLALATVLVPTLGGLLVGLLWRIVDERRPLGPPDAIFSVHSLNGCLPAKSGFLSTAGSIISLGCGASVGQYGPLVLMGSTLGARLAKLFADHLGMPAKSLGIIGIGCGAAAAIATAFNAPIAGLVFAHEVILRHYSIRAFAPVTVAATIGYVMANMVFNQSPLFRIHSVSVSAPAEYLLFIVIGVLGALVAIAFMRAVLLSAKLAKRLPVPDYLKPMLAGATLGIVALGQPEILGIGSDLLRFSTIEGAFTQSELGLLLLLKITLTALCLGFGFAGGVFSPALLIGALFGALVGSTVADVASLFSSSSGDTGLSSIAVYAICGMVSVTSPVIGAPLTSILIVFELTRNYDLALACMTSVVFANLLGYRLFGRSLFDIQLASRGIDLSLGRDKTILDLQLLQGYMSQNYISLPTNASLQEVRDALLSGKQSEAYIVDASGNYVGTIDTLKLIQLQEHPSLQTETAQNHALREHLVFDTTTSVWQAMNNIEGFVGESIPVIDKEQNGKLVGVVFEAVLVKAYLDTLHSVREEEHAGV